MSLFRRSARRARPDAVLPAPVDPATQVGAAQLGRDAGPGTVPAHLAFTDPSMGGRLALGLFPIINGAQLVTDMPPDSLYADRVLTGGAVSFPHMREYRDEPGNTGGHQVITGRLPFVIGDVEFSRETSPERASFRQPPRPDVCAAIPRVLPS